ncbi:MULTISPECIES: ABC transporter substrate-binding protein [Paracoccus]|uniref:Sugar ABC transporter substrate-binding protein n=1 Tax=Paracoccus kondratievae TaxID=135740 RepID=A0AAD3RU98_9RHOB|nr:MULTISPECIES: sugar ABC transporter substrate-binding protein [Paracoccus]GLK65338.1 sugar ABC transporter substrate-binding protein [Paracoccus kondratievae]SMG54635.1 carbohydrate ABC transporter substrate-binding protein, CUT1 family [Paracoccus sp. J56]
MQRTISFLALMAGLVPTFASADGTVRFWYHFDNPENPMAELVAKFEAENPGIRIEAMNVPWNSYYDNLYTSIVGGNAPDAAMLKMFALPRLLEMEALEPLDDWIDAWEGKDDILPNLFELTRAEDGKQYYLPVQYVALYLYYRADMFDELGLTPPQTCDEFRDAAIKLTRDTDGDGKIDTYGFGFRGGKSGHEHWGSFTLGRTGVGLDQSLVSDAGVAGTQFVIDLFQADKVFPPSAPNDGFQEIIGAFKTGVTAMTIHHVGSSNDLVAALGDKVAATTVPECGGGRWTTFGDESTAVLSNASDKEAAWKWISFLSTAENNALFNTATGQLPVTQSDTATWQGHEPRFVEVTQASLPFAHLLPSSPNTPEFVNTVWPANMQRALLGQITAQQMNEAIAALFTDD